MRWESATSHSINGKRAWDELLRIAQAADIQNKPVKNFVQLILTDVEMPEMDGYMLTKMVKSDPRFAGIPVIMRPSLSGMSNQKLASQSASMATWLNLNLTNFPK